VDPSAACRGCGGGLDSAGEDWDGGNHPGFTLAAWLRAHAEQVWLCTTNFAVDQTLARWCLTNSYLTTARNHGPTVLDAITRALLGNPWKPVPITP
jgi:hypothetical protein